MDDLANALDIGDLYAVLQAIRYAKPLPETSLHSYLMAQSTISRDMPAQLQDYYVATWLTEMIITQYNAHRSYHGLPMLNLDMPKKTLIDHIQQDYLLSNAELEIWSVLFIRYACLKASVSTDLHAQIARTTKRTLRRRQKRGIEQLYLMILTYQ